MSKKITELSFLAAAGITTLFVTSTFFAKGGGAYTRYDGQFALNYGSIAEH